SVADGSREAVLEGAIGLLVDPTSRADMVRAVCEAMARPRAIPPGLAYFAFPRFQERMSRMLTALVEADRCRSHACARSRAGDERHRRPRTLGDGRPVVDDAGR